jgi:hypothetical protein
MNAIQIGHLLRASTSGFTVGCSVSQLEAPSFGALVRAPLGNDYQVYGLIYDIHIDEDGLVRQLVTAGNISEEVMRDNRERRIVPVEMSALTVGYQEGERIRHLLPPRPPLSLDVIYLCTPEELTRFVTAGRFGYFRHLLRAREAPLGELLAAHILEVQRKTRLQEWTEAAVHELITLLRDDYPTLVSVLGALGEVVS